MDKEFVQKAAIFLSADSSRPRKEQSVLSSLDKRLSQEHNTMTAQGSNQGLLDLK